MNKDRIEELINIVNMGQASEEEAEEVKQAIANDESLASFARATKNIKDIADATPRIKVKPDFAAQVIAASRGRNSSRIEQFHKKLGFRQIVAEFIPRSKVFAYAAAAHAVLLLIAAFVVLTPAKDHSFNPNVELSCEVDEAACGRINAPKSTLSLTSEGVIDISNFNLSGYLYIVINREENHRMLVAFTPEQLKSQPSDVRQSCTPAFIRNSSLTLPPYLIEHGMGTPTRVVFLKLADRFEIWNESTYDSYIDKRG